jgi:hypothetical protein
MRDIGYETDNSLLNLGSMAYYLFFYILIMIAVSFVKLFRMKTGKCIQLYKRLFYLCFFVVILEVLKEGYLEFLISSTLNIFYAQHSQMLSD